MMPKQFAEILRDAEALERWYDEHRRHDAPSPPKPALWACTLCDRLEPGNPERPVHGPCGVHGECMNRVYRPDEIAAVLKAHSLSHIECDRETKQDNPVCACSREHLGWHPSIGEAVDAWISHVLRELAAHGSRAA